MLSVQICQMCQTKCVQKYATEQTFFDSILYSFVKYCIDTAKLLYVDF